MTNDSKRAQVSQMIRAFNHAMDETVRHPLIALREWWEDSTTCPVCGTRHGGRDPRG